jgi:hypothetical protein
LAHYRPIAFLPFVSKLIERAAAFQLNEHLSAHAVLSPYQYAYRAGHSIETLLLSVTNDLLLAADEGDASVLLFLDLSAAFDTIDHDILLDRLERHCGITANALEWFSSYLEGRSHSVSVDGTQSSCTELIWGVTQGSVLGATLYIIYVNPLAAIALFFGIHMNQYSDDTQLRHRFPVPLQSTTTDRLTACVSAPLDWFLRNRVKTNVSKTEMLFAW